MSSRPRSVAVCALLAAAVHAAVLGWGAAHSTGSTGGSAAGTGPLHTRLVQEAQPAPTAAADARSPVAEPGANEATPDSRAEPSAGAAPAEALPPRVAEIPEDVGMPDAPLPEGGVQVRAFVRLDDAGRPTDVALATWPAAAGRAFGEQFRRALENSRFEPGPGAATHCLQMDFEAGDGQPRWSWLPGGQADASRCLGARAGAASVLPRP
jgi:hypothetical protein